MKLEYSNLRYYNYKEVNEENYKSFDLDIKDLDGKFLDGKSFPFTFVVSDDPKYNTSEIAQQVLKDYKDGKINLDDIQPYEDPTPIENLKIQKQQEISNFKNNLLNTGSVMYKDDLFDIDDKALLRISGIIQAYTFQILINDLNYCYCDNCKYNDYETYGDRFCDECHRKYSNWALSPITAEKIVQPWISQTNVTHNLSFSELVELSMLMMNEVQTIVLRCNHLCQKVIPTIQDKKELYFLDWYYEDNNTDE